MDENSIIDLHEYYVKQTLRNRFEILGVNGKLTLSIPVVGQKGEKVMTKDIRIADHNWRKQHITTLKSAYGRSPFFEHYFDELESIFLKKHEFLVDFNLDALRWLRSEKIAITENHTTAFRPFNEKEIMVSNKPNPLPNYLQVFGDRFDFFVGLSSIDLLMNLGPRSADHILLWKNGK